ncbi:MAG: alkaline phosphatase family protein [Gemmatimonadota bacterium]
MTETVPTVAEGVTSAVRYRAVAFLPLVALHCMGAVATPAADPPRLTVVLVVDQMRADFLERYAPLFEGGFARILADGAVFTDAAQDHAATVTAVGHATISTGVFPARHGIVGNDVFDHEAGEAVYSAFDPAAPILGLPDAPGRSPVRIRRSGLADWLKAANPESRVFSTALKDRSAIMMGGRDPDGVYWYHDAAEGIVTSTFYTAEVPDWVEAFAFRDRVASYFSRGWDRLLPREAYDGVSREDRFEAEGRGWPSEFPHRFAEIFPDGTAESPGHDYFDDFTDTPFADEVILQFARAAVEQEGLGADDTPDLLFIGASAADYIGHRWGPYSQEVQDYYMRLDRYLGELFEALDDRVGVDEWALVLSSDHGVAPAPEELLRRGEHARRISADEYSREIRAAIGAAFEETGIDPVPTVRWLDGPHLISETASPEELRELRRVLADRFAEIDFVAAAFTSDEVAGADPGADGMLGRFRRSYYEGRSPDVMLLLEPNHIVGGVTATHGSAHWYDRQVPLVFMGPGIPAGRYDGPVRTVDIAPTLARLLGIPAPADLDGRTLTQIVP